MQVRQPSAAGMFYPADPESLRAEISTLLDDAEPIPITGSLAALIVPHAGYAYSGSTAAHAYKLLVGKKYDTIVILSPSHREYFRGISIFSGSSYRTPLGDVPIDTPLRDTLIHADTTIESSIRGHGAEHGIEVQVPFLQNILTKFKLLPIVMGNQHSELCFHLGDRLAEGLRGKNALIVASTDLSHFHGSGSARKLDQIIIDDVSTFDYQRLMNDLEYEKGEACGGGPLVAALAAARQLGADRVNILHQCNSGDVTGEHDSVVGYFSAAITKTR